MTDRLEEIERRLRAAMDVKYPCGDGPSGPELSIFYAHCYGNDGDVAFLLGEVRRLISIADEHDRNYNLMQQHHNRMMDERDEAQSLALSLAEALSDLLADTQHNHHNCGDDDCPVRVARVAFSDERLTKLREMKNG